MNAQPNVKKVISPILLAVGTILMGIALYFDMTKADIAARGPMLVIGAVAVLLGLYLFPTVEHHRSIINFIFLFPLLFTFAVTVIIPLCLGFFYSMTDWNGIRYNEFVGLSNYAAMFKDPAFLWSILLTVMFVFVNMIMVNLVGFCTGPAVQLQDEGCKLLPGCLLPAQPDRWYRSGLYLAVRVQ